MATFFEPIDDEADFRQGDVIRKFSESGEAPTWGMIVTADCDISQDKAGGKIHWLEILPSKAYIDGAWSDAQLRRVEYKQARYACEKINAAIKDLGLDLSPLDHPSLVDWLTSSSVFEILETFHSNHAAKDPKLTAAMQIVHLTACGGGSSGLAKLQKVWRILGRDNKSQQAAIREAFDSSGGFPDFVFVPALPDVRDAGFVISLRAISSIKVEGIFKSELDARINDNPYAFHRICRFNDSLRHSVSQKLGFLFSRIGMSREFEEACDTSMSTLLDTLW